MTGATAGRLRDASRALLASGVALGVALVVGALLILAAGANPGRAYLALSDGAFGSAYALGVSLQKATPLMLTGLSVLLAFRAGMLNIGAEGQLYMGALASVLVGVYVTGLPAALHATLALGAGAAAGALWGGVAGVLKAARGVNEIISTIMLNFVAIYLVSYLVQGPFAEPPGWLHQTSLIQDTAELPLLQARSGVSVGILIAIACAVAVRYFLGRTARGFELRAVGLGPDTARFSGMSIRRGMVLAMLLSGGLAGVAGATEIQGVHYRLLDGFSPGYGFDGIAVAFLARASPTGVVFAAVLFGALRVGANQMQRVAEIPGSLVLVLQGLVMLALLAASLGEWLRRRRREA
jgi:general nucleoside transport system permease protein